MDWKREKQTCILPQVSFFVLGTAEKGKEGVEMQQWKETRNEVKAAAHALVRARLEGKPIPPKVYTAMRERFSQEEIDFIETYLKYVSTGHSGADYVTRDEMEKIIREYYGEKRPSTYDENWDRAIEELSCVDGRQVLVWLTNNGDITAVGVSEGGYAGEQDRDNPDLVLESYAEVEGMLYTEEGYEDALQEQNETYLREEIEDWLKEMRNGKKNRSHRIHVGKKKEM